MAVFSGTQTYQKIGTSIYDVKTNALTIQASLSFLEVIIDTNNRMGVLTDARATTLLSLLQATDPTEITNLYNQIMGEV